MSKVKRIRTPVITVYNILSGSIKSYKPRWECYVKRKKEGEKRAWIILLLGAILATGGPVVMSLMTDGKALFWIFWLCFDLVVLLLPARDFLRQKRRIKEHSKRIQKELRRRKSSRKR